MTIHGITKAQHRELNGSFTKSMPRIPKLEPRLPMLIPVMLRTAKSTNPKKPANKPASQDFPTNPATVAIAAR
jgi:hypothetical protein